MGSADAGWKPAVLQAVADVPESPAYCEPSRARAGGNAMSSNPLLRVLDRVFLWLPNDRSPGVAAVGLYLVRQVFLPIAIIIAPIMMLMLISGSGLMLNPAAMPKWNGEAIVAILFGAIALVQELSRYAFVRRAERPLRSLIIFTVVVVACILIVYHDRFYTPAWMIAAQLAASAVIFFGLRRRELIPFVLAGLIVCQTAIDVTAPQLFPAKEPPAPKVASPLNLNPPAVGDMPAWAKIYPGATVTKSKTSKLLGLTSWEVDYKTSATPEQIGAFYQQIAKEQGFEESGGFAGVHILEQKATSSRFTYAVDSEGGVSEVNYEARAFDTPVPRN
jgi:hypothetical protein